MWKIVFTDKSRKAFKKLDTVVQRRISQYLAIRVAKNPKALGDMLTGDKAGLWRYRVGDYRVICEMLDHELIVQVIRVGHRKEIYDF